MKNLIFVLMMVAGFVAKAQQEPGGPPLNFRQAPFYMLDEQEMESFSAEKRRTYFQNILGPIKELKTNSMIRQQPASNVKEIEGFYNDNWSELMTNVYTSCRSEDNAATCKKLENVRLETIGVGRQSAEDRAAIATDKKAEQKLKGKATK